MKEKPLYRQIKAIPFIFLLIVLTGTIISLYYTIHSIDRTKILNVSVRGLKEKTIKHVTLGENFFTAGYEGQLYWKFTSQFRNVGIVKYLYISYLILFFMPLIKKP